MLANLITQIPVQIMRIFTSLVMLYPLPIPEDVGNELDAHKIKYEVVEEIPGFPRTAGAAYTDGTIFINANYSKNGAALRNLVAHEMIHKVRVENGLWTGDQRFEEIIAVYGTKRASQTMGFGRAKFNEKRMIRKTLEVNNTSTDPVTDEEIQRAEPEIQETLVLMKRLYGG